MENQALDAVLDHNLTLSADGRISFESDGSLVVEIAGTTEFVMLGIKLPTNIKMRAVGVPPM